MPEQVPSVGRVVHFMYAHIHVPAIIIDPAVERDGEIVQTMFVMTMIKGNFHTAARYDPEMAAGTWHWPEFVPPKG